MRKKTIIILLIVALIAGLAWACGAKATVKKLGDIEIEMLEPGSLKDKSLQQWYEDSYKMKFSHDVSHIDGYKYILICAGEMPTGGYSIDITNALKENGELLFYAKLVKPEKSENASEGTSYPHVLFRIKEDNEVSVRVELDMGGETGDLSTNSHSYSDIRGVYIGQADRNFIEVLVDKSVNFPGNEKPVIFKLNSDVELSPNDPVKLDCVKNEQGQWEIVKIERISGGEFGEKSRGEFVGQIDANSVEIIIDGNPLAFQLADQVKLLTDLEGIAEGTPVEISFINDDGSMIITELQVNPE